MDLLRQALPAGFAAGVTTAVTGLSSRLPAMRAELVAQASGRRAAPWAGVGGVGAVLPLVLAVVALPLVALALGWHSADSPGGSSAGAVVAPHWERVELLSESVARPATAGQRERLADEAVAARLEVVVFDAARNPIASSRVLVYPEVPRGTLRARWQATDRDGVAVFAALPSGTYRVVRLSGGERRVVVAGGVQRLELEVPAYVQVEGEVVDRAGNPVAGAEVRMVLPGGRGHLGHSVARTDAHGAFALSRVQPGRSIAAVAPGRVASELQRIGRSVGVAQRLALRLGAPAGRITGIVRGPSGYPVSRATVQLGAVGTFDKLAARPSVAVHTAADGRFECSEVPPGRVPLWVAAPGLAASRLVVEVDAGAVLDLDLELGRGATASGVVTDPKGLPLPRALLRVEPREADPLLQLGPRWAYPQVRCAPDGSYRVEALPNGVGQLVAMRPLDHQDGYRVVTSGVVDFRERENLRWDARFGRVLRWRGVLVDEHGTPLPNWELWLSVAEPGDTGRQLQARTDGFGRFALDTPRAENFALHVRDPASASSGPNLVRDDLRWRDEHRLVVPDRLLANARLAGIALAASGAPAAGATVVLSRSSGASWREIGRTSVAADGCFEIGPLAEGEYRLDVHRADDAVAGVRRVVRLVTACRTDLGVLRLP